MPSVPIQIQFDVEPSDPDSALGLEVFLSDQSCWRQPHVSKKQTVQIELDDAVHQDHELRIEMWGKTWAHTQLDSDGKVIRDAELKITNFSVDEIDSTDLFYAQGIYYHDFNGNAKLKYQVPFSGLLGCNGTVLWRFKTPYYLWILDTM